MPTPKIVSLQERMSDHMDAILRCFRQGAAITVVVRNPKYGDADVVIGNDDLDAAIEAIKTMQKREPTFKQDVACRCPEFHAAVHEFTTISPAEAEVYSLPVEVESDKETHKACDHVWGHQLECVKCRTCRPPEVAVTAQGFEEWWEKRCVGQRDLSSGLAKRVAQEAWNASRESLSENTPKCDCWKREKQVCDICQGLSYGMEAAWKEFQPKILIGGPGSTWTYECFKAGWRAALSGEKESEIPDCGCGCTICRNNKTNYHCWACAHI